MSNGKQDHTCIYKRSEYCVILLTMNEKLPVCISFSVYIILYGPWIMRISPLLTLVVSNPIVNQHQQILVYTVLYNWMNAKKDVKIIQSVNQSKYGCIICWIFMPIWCVSVTYKFKAVANIAFVLFIWSRLQRCWSSRVSFLKIRTFS